ncbi:hypothetical protein ABW19_dt0206284 [Dactylella cylindrospora]|nr:hypothetical protein ABW19_dt0206284 [Dactylella cylindrospora]
MVAVRRPCEVKGKDKLWFARLPHLDVNDYIEFVEHPEGSPAPTSREIFEGMFDQWFDLTDPSKSPWKVTVVDNTTIYYSFNHILSDGRSGYFFHREFLSALNDDEEDTSSASNPAPLQRMVPTCSKDWPDVHGVTIASHHKLNVFWFLMSLLFQVILELILFPKYMTYGNVKQPKFKPEIKQFAPPEQRIKNKLVSLRLNPATMEKLIAECREKSTTFTAFFETLLNVSLSSDAYPKARALRVSMVVDLRKMCDYPYGEMMSNMGASFTQFRLTSPYAVIGRAPKNAAKEAESIYTDVAAFWNMAKRQKEIMNRDLEQGAIRESVSASMSPTYIDDFPSQVYPSLRTIRNFSSLISNLVILTPREQDKDREWRFTGTDWAGSHVRSDAGPGLTISISSLPGADCVINLGYQEGTYEPEVIPGLAVIMQKRIKQVLLDDSLAISVSY